MDIKEKKQIIIISLITLVLLFVNILILINKVITPMQKNRETEQKCTAIVEEERGRAEDEKEKSDEALAKEELLNLQNMSEAQRMKFYFYKFIEYIELEEYEKAYNLLYEDFKNNYFKTKDDFEKYVKEKYPEVMVIEYSSVQRQGQYYILTVKIKDIDKQNDETSAINQKFIVYENNYNDFKLSFQVK